MLFNLFTNHAAPTTHTTHTVTEDWKAIPGFEGYYEASDLGSIRRKGSFKTLAKNGTRNGYLKVTLSVKGVPSTRHIHSLILETFVGPKPQSCECCHNDGNKHNNRVDNLRWDTHAANVRDNSKLDWPEIREIREAYSKGSTIADISRTYGLIWETASAIVKGKSWKEAGTVDTTKTGQGPQQKLQVEQVREIRARYGKDTTLRTLASDYGVSISTVSDVVNGRTWKSVKTSCKAEDLGVKSKLSWPEVRQIRALYAENKANQTELARAFGVTQPTVNRIVKNITWVE